MSFFNRLRSTSEKSKNQKQKWEPPKIPPVEKAAKVYLQGEATETESSFDFLREDDKEKPEDVSTQSSFSFLNSELNTVKIQTAESIDIDEKAGQSPFLFLSEASKKQSDEKIYIDNDSGKSKFSFISDHANTVTPTPNPKQTVRKKLEITPRKKKKKAIKPGYGKTMEAVQDQMIDKARSLSTASSSETRSEGSEDVGTDELDEEDERSIDRADEISIGSNQGFHKDSVGSCDSSSVFNLISDGTVDDSVGRETKKKNIAEIDKDINTEDSLQDRSVVDMSTKELSDDVQTELKNSIIGDSLNDSGKDINASVTELDTCDKFPQERQSEESEEISILLNSCQDSETSSSKTYACSESVEIDACLDEETINELTDVIVPSQNEHALVSYQLYLDEEEKVELYLETLESRESFIREELKSLKGQYNAVLLSYEKTTYSKECLVSQIRQFQEEQTLAISKEDFFLAEKLNQQLEQKQTELNNLKYKHPILEEKVSEFVKESNEAIEKTLQDCQDLERGFDEIIKGEKENLDQRVVKNDTELYKAKLKLDEEKTKLDRERGHITLDREHLLKGKLKLDSEIGERTKDKQEEKNKLSEERENVRSEIEDLEAKLKSLREKHVQISSKIEEVDSSIQEMIIDFIPQRERLEKEEKELGDKEEDMNYKSIFLEQEEADLNKKQEKRELFEQRCKDNIETLSKKMKDLKLLKEEMEVNKISLADIINFDLLRFSPSEEHQQYMETLKNLTDELSTANSKDIENNAQISRLKKKLDDIEARIEELEKEKQIAVSGRHFKAAKAITDERNTCMKNGQQDQEELKRLELERAELNATIERLNKEISNTKEKFLAVETELDKRISSSLAEAVNALLDYFGRSKSQSWIRPLLQFEIQICKDIIRDIHTKYNWPMPNVLTADDIIYCEGKRNEEDLSSKEDDAKKSLCSGEEEKDAEVGIDKISNAEIEELERQLQEAVENEDFDQADEINSKIEECKKHLKQ